MPLYPLPPNTDFVTTGQTKGTFKGALTGLRGFLNSLLGSTGSQADALTALGAVLNGSLAKTGAYTVVAADRGKVIDCTGTWSLAIDAVGTLGAGFAFAVRNSGSGMITVNPNLSEQINLASTLILGPYESCAVVPNADASGWIAVFSGGAGGASGQVAAFAMNTAPVGWLKANGAAVSRTSYAALFAAIGTTFGVGDGSTTFNLPDLRGEFIRGWDDSRGVDSGRVFGSAQGGEIQSHSHTVSSSSPIISGINAATLYGVDSAGGAPLSLTSSAGGGAETRPRNIALLACIKY